MRKLAAAAVIAAGVCTATNAFPIGDPYETRSVLEYFNHDSRHYLLLSNPAEIAAVEAGAAGPGWVATGYGFAARNESVSPRNVCRFYAPAPTSAHFFTANPEECAALKGNPGMIFEGLDFSIEAPQGGRCTGFNGGTPIYRLYNEHAPIGQRSHRFIHDAATRDDMIAAGWRDEGIAFCSPGAGRQERKLFFIRTQQVRPSTECENEAINIGSCVATNQLPALDKKILGRLPPLYVTQNPAYSPRFTQLTGFDGDVFTSQPVTDPEAVARHSFAQTLHFEEGPVFGMHLSYLDRTRGDLSSINPLYQFRTTAPAANAPDERLLPWAFTQENEIVVSFFIDVRTIRRLNGNSHAYGHPTLQFTDTSSGQQLAVTLATYGTGVPGTPGDLLAMDAATGGVIVGTAFRDDPLFGKRLWGSFLHCDGDANQGGCEPGDFFSFRIRREDFIKVLGLARGLNPQLSADPTRYLLANFNFNNAIYREAELGLTVSNYHLQVYGY